MQFLNLNHHSTPLSIIFFLNKMIIPYRSRFSIFFFRDLVVFLVRRVVIVVLVRCVVVVVLVRCLGYRYFDGVSWL